MLKDAAGEKILRSDFNMFTTRNDPEEEKKSNGVL